MHPEKLNEIENFYSGILKKAKNVATSPKTGKVIGGVYKEAKSVSANLNPAGKFLNKASDELFKSGNFGWYILGGIIILLIIAFIMMKIK
jgi:hypothetical protein